MKVCLHTVVVVCVLLRVLLPVVLECPWVAFRCVQLSFERNRETEFLGGILHSIV